MRAGPRDQINAGRLRIEYDQLSLGELAELLRAFEDVVHAGVTASSTQTRRTGRRRVDLLADGVRSGSFDFGLLMGAPEVLSAAADSLQISSVAAHIINAVRRVRARTDDDRLIIGAPAPLGPPPKRIVKRDGRFKAERDQVRLEETILVLADTAVTAAVSLTWESPVGQITIDGRK